MSGPLNPERIEQRIAALRRMAAPDSGAAPAERAMALRELEKLGDPASAPRSRPLGAPTVDPATNWFEQAWAVYGGPALSRDEVHIVWRLVYFSGWSLVDLAACARATPMEPQETAFVRFLVTCSRRRHGPAPAAAAVAL